MNCHSSARFRNLRQSILVIGYGNSLRSDDGVGQRVAKEIRGWGMPNVTAIAVHQLTPDLVEPLAKVDEVIFVDVYPTSANQNVQVRSLELAQSGVTTGHWCAPQVLLAMVQALYGYHPEAWWVMVPGVNFELGEYLSPLAERGIEAALEQIEYLMKSVEVEPCMKLK